MLFWNLDTYSYYETVGLCIIMEGVGHLGWKIDYIPSSSTFLLCTNLNRSATSENKVSLFLILMTVTPVRPTRLDSHNPQTQEFRQIRPRPAGT